MCGFAGFWSPSGSGSDPMKIAQKMTDAILHRGPDDVGFWSGEPADPVFGHCRLSIIDLSPEGSQPMRSASGRFVLNYNGEIYNFPVLRRELMAAGTEFRGHSDTEVLVAAIDHWGLEGALQKCAGMFAFALWDRRDRSLHLVRDRLGEKPLYYGQMGSTLLFGSDLRAIKQHPEWRGEIDRDALLLYLRYGYVPAPFSIYRSVQKVLPGTILTFRENTPRPAETVYWSARLLAEEGVAHPFRLSDVDATDALENVLRRTISEEMISDVPLGAFLSGGLDSSTIVALMQAQSQSPVQTFTIGFHESGYNEAENAKAVARHLGTDHTELYVTPEAARDVIPLLPQIYSEPFADSSQVPTFLVARLAKSRVKVSLSGDGGDELFGGYNRYFWGDRIWRAVRPVPPSVRRAARRAIVGIPQQRWDEVGAVAMRALPRSARLKMIGDKAHKAAHLIGASSLEGMYLDLVSNWRQPSDVVLGGVEPESHADRLSAARSLPDMVHRMMLMDLLTYLPDDIMVKVDRATMAVSLEGRAPFLDHRVAEFAWRLPMNQKIRGKEGKWLLRQVAYRHIPKNLLDRPKMGFGIPVGSWLRGPLRGWAENLLSPSRIEREGFFDSRVVTESWQQHLSGRRDLQSMLWIILMFQAWLDAG